MPLPYPHGEFGFDDTRSAWGGGGQGSNPGTGDPVNLTDLSKTEIAVDFRVKLPGSDFVWSRSYSSRATFGDLDPTFGYGWSGNAFLVLNDTPASPLVMGQSREDVQFVGPDGDNVYRARGVGSQELCEEDSGSTQLTLDGYPGQAGYLDVWTLREPGKWEIDFYKRDTGDTGIPAGADGRMLQYRDAYGNTRTYVYEDLVNVSGAVRLSKIYLNGTQDPGGMSDPSDAVIDLTWFDIGGSDDHDGYLDRVEVVRKNGGSTIVTQWVDYEYASEVNPLDISDDVADSGAGSEALLVQVAKGVLVDDVPVSLSAEAGGNYHVRFTQYRYHNGDFGSDYPADPQDANGPYGALKSVTTPEQIEFLAQLLNADATGGGEPIGSLGKIGEAPYLAAAAVLDADDDTDLDPDMGSVITPVDLASKVVSYNGSVNDEVSVQWLQASCGCAGGSAGSKRLEYSVIDNDDTPSGPGLSSLSANLGRTIKIEEYVGTTATQYREYRYDLVFPRGTSGAAYLVGKALYDHAESNGWWVWWYDHHFESDGVNAYGRPGGTYDVYTPSALGGYTPASVSTEAAYTAATSGGLVHRHEYNSDRKWTGSSEGTLVSGSLSFTPVTRLAYPGSDSTSGRTYLPSTIERNRTGTAWGSATADEIETTTYSYKFADATTSAVLRMGVALEAELVAENGPGVQTYDWVRMYDDRGRLVWVKAPDESMTYRGYDATTGALTTLIRNADPDGTDSSNPAFVHGDYGYLSDPGWDTYASGGDLETTIEVDLLGRWVSQASPGGVETSIRREVVADSERVGVAYLSTIVLPHKLSGTSPAEFDGPAVRSWTDAAGKPTRESSYAVDGSQTYTPSGGVYTLDDELSRWSAVHDIHGQAIKCRRWHDIAGTNFSGSAGYDEWSLSYDTYGRLVELMDPEETVTVLEYDAIDRLIAVKRNTLSSGVGDVTLGRAYYDNGASASQGVGNGNVSRVDYFTQEPGSGGLSSGTRTVYRSHDYRDRVVKIENPSAPHYAFEYDNLDRLSRSASFSATPTDVDTPSASRGLLRAREYSQRGLVYRMSVAVDPTDSAPDYLESDLWYDANGRVIKSLPHSSPSSKYAYDGLGRVTESYLTDAKGDAKPGNSGNYASADDVTGDTVFEQSSYTYSNTDEDGLLDLVERRVRLHDSSSTGSLGSSDGVTSWMGYFYDEADRLTHTVDFGTTEDVFETGGTAPSWPPGTAPSATSGSYNSDDYIVTERVFNTRGLLDRSVDPKGDVTKYLYDDASRMIAVIEAYDDAALDSPQYASGRWQFVSLDDDADRVTSYVYNGVGDVVRMAAHLPDGGSDDAQVTEYVYGVSAAVGTPGVDDSLIHSWGLLLKTVFPDETTGDAGSGTGYEVSYSYNALGELRSVTDQNGTLHAFERDAWGRVTADRVDTFGTVDIDDTVKRIEIAYDGLGRVDTVESRSHATSGMGSVLNGVAYEYTPLWQIEALHQDMDGVASTDGTGGTETVEYAYGTTAFDSDAMSIGAHNYTRLAKIAYPLDTIGSPTVTAGYGNTSSVDARVSRLANLSAGGLGALVQYDHVGFGRVAEVDYASPDVQLDRTFSHDGKRRVQGYSSQASGVYPGWDRFGRVRVQAWVDGDLDVKRSGQVTDPNADVPGVPPIIEELQTYNRASMRTGRIDARPGAKRASRDYDLSYDGLDRLTSAKRGSWDDAYSPTAWTPVNLSPGNSEAWTYDAIGNWDESLVDGNYDGDFGDTGSGAGYVDLAETRSHNMANELTDIDEDQNVGGVDLSFLYDSAGNRTKKTYVTGGGYDEYVYDAWNRLVKIERTDDAEPPVKADLASYEYNGLHFRIKETSGDQTREMYYGVSWRLLEEHVDEPGETPDREVQHFWGKRYIDDAVMHRVREAGEETWAAGDTFFHLTDPQYSTLAIIDASAVVKERVHYSSYGVPSAYRQGDVTGDGLMNSSDSAFFAVADIDEVGTNVNYTVEHDMNRDGETTMIELTGDWVTEASKPQLGDGVLSDVSVVDNRTGYGGYRWEPDTLLWHVRHRAYDPYAGRWLQRDPIGYVDGASLYQYARSGAAHLLDPTGLILIVDPGRDRDGRTKDRTRDALRMLCPDADINDDNEVTLPDEICPDEDGNEPPGCDLLKKLIKDKDTIQIWVDPKRQRRPKLDIQYKPEWKYPLRRIRWYPEYQDPFSVRNPDGTLKPDRVPEEFETLWHELIHALRHLEGEHYIYPPHYDNVDESEKAWEEIKTIDKLNEYREWARKEYNIDLPDRDPYGHPLVDPNRDIPEGD